MLFNNLPKPDKIFIAEKNKLERSDLFTKITSTKEFERLKYVRFMGAIDYTTDNNLKSDEKNRATHSIDVAVLASYISKKRKYSDELTRHLIIAGLLHDIGHLPLSHSLEREIKKHTGHDHHRLGQDIIKPKTNTELSKILKKNCDVNLILDLINGRASNADGGDLFSSRINIDTIDGIHRASRYIHKNECYDRIKVAYSAFKPSNELSQTDWLVLDDFWNRKNFIYKDFIQNKHGLFSDFIGGVVLGDNLKNEDNIFEKNGMLKSEKSWQQKFTNVFDCFKSIRKYGLLKDGFEKVYTIDITRKIYKIKKSEASINNRYFFERLGSTQTIETKLIPLLKQSELPL